MHSLRRHLLEVEAQRKDDPGAAVHPPEEHADAVLGRLREALIPEQELPVERPALDPERRVEDAAVGLVSRAHVALEVMAGDQLVMHRGAGEMDVVPAHAHHLRLVRHRARRVRDGDRLAAGEEGVHELRLGRHHGHAPRVAAEPGDRHHVVGVEVFDRLDGEVADQGGLLARLDVERLDVLEGRVPVVAQAHLASGLLHLALAPAQLLAGEVDQLFGRVRDHLRLELAQQCIAADRRCRRSRGRARRSSRRVPPIREQSRRVQARPVPLHCLRRLVCGRCPGRGRRPSPMPRRRIAGGGSRHTTGATGRPSCTALASTR